MPSVRLPSSVYFRSFIVILVDFCFVRAKGVGLVGYIYLTFSNNPLSYRTLGTVVVHTHLDQFLTIGRVRD